MVSVAKRARRSSSLAGQSPAALATPGAAVEVTSAVTTSYNIDSIVDPAGDEVDHDYACSNAGTEPSDSDSEESDDEQAVPDPTSATAIPRVW